MNHKNLNNIAGLALAMTLLGCGVLPIKSEIKENHFRFENFKIDVGSQEEYVYLMCFHKKPTSWQQPKQYPAGDHNLWIKADISNNDRQHKEAYAQFKLHLDAGKSYMVNRKINDEKISMWIQEVDTGLRISDIVTTDLERPSLKADVDNKARCKLASI